MRTSRFREVLQVKPVNQEVLLEMARHDIPPALRSELWPLLLGVDNPVAAIASVGGEIDDNTRSQIGIDVRRCHQYHPVLASQDGKTCLKQVLELWCRSSGFAYWQGVDSLAAPFVVAHFHRARRPLHQSEDIVATDQEESLEWMQPAINAACSCLCAWTHLCLDGVFMSGTAGTALLRQKMSLLSVKLEKQLPELAAHLEAEGVTPDLYAIPWILTLFSHVLPISSTMQIWDRFLVTGKDRIAELTTSVAVGILQQFAKDLVCKDFDDILIYLSRPPPVDCDMAVRWALDNMQ